MNLIVRKEVQAYFSIEVEYWPCLHVTTRFDCIKKLNLWKAIKYISFVWELGLTWSCFLWNSKNLIFYVEKMVVNLKLFWLKRRVTSKITLKIETASNCLFFLLKMRFVQFHKEQDLTKPTTCTKFIYLYRLLGFRYGQSFRSQL